MTRFLSHLGVKTISILLIHYVNSQFAVAMHNLVTITVKISKTDKNMTLGRFLCLKIKFLKTYEMKLA